MCGVRRAIVAGAARFSADDAVGSARAQYAGDRPECHAARPAWLIAAGDVVSLYQHRPCVAAAARGIKRRLAERFALAWQAPVHAAVNRDE